MGQDALHPRQVAMLDDPLFVLLGSMFHFGERWAILPTSTFHVLMALLEKPGRPKDNRRLRLVLQGMGPHHPR
eukprot:10338944-Lingulodinium_polyedra.AAC.1